MLGKTAAVLALAVSFMVTGSPPSQAGAKGPSASENSPWWDTNYNTAQSRDNLTEKVLSPTTVPKVGYLRSVVSRIGPPKNNCPGPMVSPVLAGGDLYVMANDVLTKYNAATGSVIWRSVPDPTYSENYNTVDVASNNLIIVAGSFCFSQSEPPGDVWAINASTGAIVWHSTPTTEEIDGAVVTKSDVIASGIDAAGYSIAVLNLSNGKTLWTGGGCQGGTNLPLQVGNLVMTYCDSQGNATAEARNLTTGTVVWSLPSGWLFQRGDQGGPQGTHLYATDPSGAVVDLNPQTGKVQYTLSGAVNVLAVDSSRVYATCNKGNTVVCAYSTSTGGLEWTHSESGAVVALAADADGVLYLDQGDALNAATGHVIKRSLWPGSDFGYVVTALAVGDGRIAVSGNPRVVDLFGLSGS